MLAGHRARRELLDGLQSTAPGHPISFWQLEMTKKSLEFALKPRVNKSLSLLLDLTQSHVASRAIIIPIIYGGLLDPDPSMRPTAMECGSLLLELESGHGVTSQRHAVDVSPVWERTWVANRGREQDMREEWPSLEDSTDDDCDNTPFTTSFELAKEDHPLDLAGHYSVGSTHKPFMTRCPYCEIVGRPIALRVHLRSWHRSRPVYECRRGHLFKDKKHLTEHICEEEIASYPASDSLCCAPATHGSQAPDGSITSHNNSYRFATVEDDGDSDGSSSRTFQAGRASPHNVDISCPAEFRSGGGMWHRDDWSDDRPGSSSNVC
jgi:hypothetical protein